MVPFSNMSPSKFLINWVYLNSISLGKSLCRIGRQNINSLAFHKSYFSFNISNISFLMNETGLQCTLLYLTHDNSNCTTKKTAYLSIFAILCNKALNLQPNTERNKKQQYLHTSQIIQVVGLLNDSIVLCNYWFDLLSS